MHLSHLSDNTNDSTGSSNNSICGGGEGSAGGGNDLGGVVIGPETTYPGYTSVIVDPHNRLTDYDYVNCS
jgi:hypothetical protein